MKRQRKKRGLPPRGTKLTDFISLQCTSPPIRNTHEDYVGSPSENSSSTHEHDDRFTVAIGNNLKTNNTLGTLTIPGHSMRWAWTITEGGRPGKGAYRSVLLRNWDRRIWDLGAMDAETGKPEVSIIANIAVLELWLRMPAKENPVQTIYAAWNKADILAREFARMQGIKIKPIPSPHLADLQRGHFVLETPPKGAIAPLLAQLAAMPRETRSRSGLIPPDASHPKHHELTGPDSPEAAQGADFMFLKVPGVIGRHEREIAEVRGVVMDLAHASRGMARTSEKILESVVVINQKVEFIALEIKGGKR